jgi:hypothetical protein
MKKLSSLFCALFSIALSVSLSSPAFAQNNSLPSDLTEKSSLAEIVQWLDETSFAKARIGVHSSAPQIDSDTVPDAATTYPEWAVFAQGFRLVKSDGCHLVLRNDAIELIEFASKYPDTRNGSFANFRKTKNKQFSGDLLISLERLSGKKGKSPYRLNTKSDLADLLGTWQTKFIGKGLKIDVTENKWRIPGKTVTLTNDIVLEITASGENGGNESMDADDLTFTFDDRETSEKFYAAFRQAVNLCKED